MSRSKRLSFYKLTFGNKMDSTGKKDDPPKGRNRSAIAKR